MGISPYKNRLFIALPRRSPGIPSTLNYIDLNDTSSNQNPLLRPYPDLETNQLNVSFSIYFSTSKLILTISPPPPPQSPRSNSDRIISVYRPSVDYTCDRLWFIDTGILDYGAREQVQRPSIWIIDLKTGQRVRRFEIPLEDGTALASITVDVEPGRCDAAFAYFPDFFNYRLHVYSFEENRLWTFVHNFFYLDPLQGDFNVAGQRYQWRDGIFSITLGPTLEDGFRSALFHPMSSLNEYMVSTRILQNRTNAERMFHGQDFQFLGRRQEFGQSNIHDFDETTGVVFYSEVARNAIGCWNSGDKFAAETHDIVFRDDLRLIYPSDLKVDNEGNLWVLSNRMPEFMYGQMDVNAFNFRVWKGKTSEIIKGTNCE